MIPFLIPPTLIQPPNVTYSVSEAKAIQAFFNTELGEFPQGVRPPEKPPEPPPPPPPPPTPPPPPPPVYEPPAPPPAPSGSCHDWLAQAGVTDITNAYDLIMRESGCNPNAVNPYSGACGIGQQLPCGKWPHQWNDPVGSIIDMQGYVFGRYGSWANANAFQRANNWY